VTLREIVLPALPFIPSTCRSLMLLSCHLRQVHIAAATPGGLAVTAPEEWRWDENAKTGKLSCQDITL
jgi:hypothetical protein